MSTARPPLDAHEPSAALGAALDEVEALLEARARLRLERPPAGDEGALRAHLARARARLEQAAAADPSGCERHAARLAAARARCALHGRDVPTGVLDGLYADVRAAAGEGAPWSRSRMSDAFLDAPRSLARWRAAAAAACLLLAVGGGLLWTRGLAGLEGGAAVAGDEDLRYRVLAPLVEGEAAPAPSPARRAGAGRFVSTRPAERDPSFYLFYDADSQSAEARRRLDAVKVRIFPVGVPATDVEQN